MAKLIVESNKIEVPDHHAGMQPCAVVASAMHRFRAEQTGRFDKIEERLASVERRLGDINDSMITALGMAAHGNVVAERHGERFGELENEIASLQRRVAALEETK